MFNSPDRLVRGFLGFQNQTSDYNWIDTAISEGIEDPTYLGFHMKFNFYMSRNLSDLNSTLPGLLLPKTDINSATNYLRRTQHPIQAAYLDKFIEHLRDIQENRPWYFQTLGGLNEVWKQPAAGDTFRGKEKILTIETLESVDLRMTFLADLYRKSTYDWVYHRELLTENLKSFDVRVIVCEIRNIGRVIDLVADISDQIAVFTSEQNLGTSAGEINISEEQVSNASRTPPPPKYIKRRRLDGGEFEETLVDDNSEIDKGNITYINNPAFLSYQATTPNLPAAGGPPIAGPERDSAGNPSFLSEFGIDNPFTKIKHSITSLNQYLSFLVFDLSHCHFIFNDIPFLDTLSMSTMPEMAKQKFQIQIGNVHETHQYGVWEYILADDYDHAAFPDRSEYEKKFSDKMEKYASWTHTADQGRSLDEQTLRQKGKNQLLGDTDPFRTSTLEEKLSQFKVPNKEDVIAMGKKAIGQEIKKGEQKLNALKMQAQKPLDEFVDSIDPNNPLSIIKAFDKLKGEIKSSLSPELRKKLDAAAETNFDRTNVFSNSDKSHPKLDVRHIDLKPADKNKIIHYSRVRRNQSQTYLNIFSKEELDKIQGLVKTADRDLLFSYIRQDLSGRNYKNVGLEGTPANETPTGISLDGAGKNLNISSIELLGTESNRTISSIELEGAAKNTTPSTISLEGPAANTNITEISLEGAPKTPGPNPITLEGAPKTPGPNPISLEGAPKTPGPNPITLEGTPKTPGPDPISLEGAAPNKTITGIVLEGASPNLNISNIELLGAAANQQITDIELTGATANTTPTEINLEGVSVNSNISNIELLGANANEQITDIELTGAGANTGITDIDLEGASKNTTVSPTKITLESLYKNTKISPKNVFKNEG